MISMILFKKSEITNFFKYNQVQMADDIGISRSILSQIEIAGRVQLLIFYLAL